MPLLHSLLVEHTKERRMDYFDETPREIPQLALLSYGVDGTTFRVTASIAKTDAFDGPLCLAAPLLSSVEIVGPGGRIAWAERVPVSVRSSPHTGGTIEIGEYPPLIFDLVVPDDAFVGGFTSRTAMQALNTSATRLHVSVEDPGIARFRSAAGVANGERDGRLVGSSVGVSGR